MVRIARARESVANAMPATDPATYLINRSPTYSNWSCSSSAVIFLEDTLGVLSVATPAR